MGRKSRLITSVSGGRKWSLQGINGGFLKGSKGVFTGAKREVSSVSLWFKRAMNRDVLTRPLARPFACSLAPPTHSLLACLLASLACSTGLIRLLAHLLVGKWIFLKN